MTVNSESIYGTRPRVLFGEGRTADASYSIRSEERRVGKSVSVRLDLGRSCIT